MTKQNKVAVDLSRDFTDSEKAHTRTNTSADSERITHALTEADDTKEDN